MPHDHILVDDDNHFIIDGITRQVTNITGHRPSVMQYDHNSERLTFQMPRYIEGHDMLLCDRVELHYTNTGKGTSVSNRPVIMDKIQITDVAASVEDPEIITFSWTISQNATIYAGTLVFQIKFICSGETAESSPLLIWHTDKYSFVDVLPSLNVNEFVISGYPDILDILERKVEGLEAGIEVRMGKPVALDAPEDMDAILANATEDDVGRMYLYTGETNESYTNGAVYSIQEEEG